jgi:ribonuclease-3
VSDESGPDHAKQFTIEVLIDGEVAGRGVGRSKKAAEIDAARRVLDARSRSEVG